VRISRRGILRGLGVGVVTGAAAESFGPLSFAETQQQPQGKSQLARPILLDQNENPYGPSEKVLAVLREATSVSNRYPRQEAEALRGKLAALHKVKEEQILVGCGSTEILRMAAAAFLGPGRSLVQAVPTYASLSDFAWTIKAEVVEVPLTKAYEHDLSAMLDRAGKSTGLVYICNPNNPTGSLTRRKDIEAFLRKLPGNVTVLIDEAYCHFVSPHQGYASFLDQPFDDTRLVVCRTFSAVYGLAGMRIGYAVGSPDLVRKLSAGQLRDGVSVVSLKAAGAALDDQDYVRSAIQRNADDRQEFMNQANIRMQRAIDSHASFAMLNTGRPPDMIIEHLQQNNVLVAPSISSMPKYVRVSFGTPAEIQEFWKVMDLLPPTGKMAM
jgi:histidinol-phosphate aminotransferase